MAALVAVETCLLVVLGLLVAGLLRSHADIRVALNLSPDADQRYVPQRPLADPQMGTASDIEGVSPSLEPMRISVDNAAVGTLIAFLSSGCLTCHEFWEALASPEDYPLPDGAAVVIVTQGPSDESIAKVKELVPRSVPVVMSSDAWHSYGVPGAPYFVWVDSATRAIQGVGAATKWASVLKLLNDSLAEAHDGASSRKRVMAEEAELIAAGIYPGDPTLNEPVRLNNE